jgi:hypothetical protein
MNDFPHRRWGHLKGLWSAFAVARDSPLVGMYPEMSGKVRLPRKRLVAVGISADEWSSRDIVFWADPVGVVHKLFVGTIGIGQELNIAEVHQSEFQSIFGGSLEDGIVGVGRSGWRRCRRWRCGIGRIAVTESEEGGVDIGAFKVVEVMRMGRGHRGRVFSDRRHGLGRCWSETTRIGVSWRGL